MPRIARIVIPDCPHHVTQRGNNRQDVFFVDQDRQTYLGLLNEECQKHGLVVHGYCLMTNQGKPGKTGDSHLFTIDTSRGEAENRGMPRIARIVIPDCPHHVTQRGNNRQDVFFVDQGKTGDSHLFTIDTSRGEAENRGMPRIARIVIPDCPHHVTQRGNNRQDVFFVDQDRQTYLGLLNEECQKHGLVVHGYCLMTNHVHLIATPQSGEALAQALGRTDFRYTQYINRWHRRSGHLWQNRFYSCTLDEEHYWSALAYVEQNPVRARLVRRAWCFRWSSAAAHCGESREDSELLDLSRWRLSMAGPAWKTTLSEMLGKETVSTVRLSTHRGRPLGSDRFLCKIERLVGRRLRPLPVGRPRKEAARKEVPQGKR